MKTFTTLYNLYGTLSQNTSADNIALGKQLINDQHRYLLQKYFDNERTVTITTIGGQSLTLTGSLSANATSATLTAAWTYPTYEQLVTFTPTVSTNGSEQRLVKFTNDSATITWSTGLLRAATTAIKTLGVQDYNIPANVSKIKNNTINVGQLKFQPSPIMTRQEWDDINFLPYNSDIPQYFFIYNGKLSIWPIPTTTGNIITFNYKTKVADLSFADYSTGNISAATANSTAITGTSTLWSATGGYPTGVDISYYGLHMKINPPYGDGIWYPIYSFTSDTALTLALPIVNAPNITASSTYTIGQIPLLQEDFHDMLVYGPLRIYFSSIVKDEQKYKEYDTLFKEKLALLDDYAGTKSVNVDLGSEPQQTNPNLFYYSN